MENWKEYYKSHTMSVEDAVKLIEPGDTLWVGNSFCVPVPALDALADRYEELENVTILSCMYAVPPPKMLSDIKYRKAFRQISYFPNTNERKAHDAGILEYASIPFGYLVNSVCDVYHCNVVMVEVCEPDENGMVNLNPFGAFFNGAILQGAHVTKCIAVMNKYQGHARSESLDVIQVPVSKFSAFCHADHTLASLPEADPQEVDNEIAAQIMAHVRDGDTVQVGKGGLGNAIGFRLDSKKDISVYAEIVSDWVMPLAEKGVLKKILMGGVFGTSPLYDFALTSPLVETDMIPHLANPDTIGALDNFIAINSCMMADLTGQACSEGAGAWQYSSVGGQLEFVKGCNKIRKRGGRAMSFLALRATRTDKEGKLFSNIVVEFPPVSTVTTPRGETMYFVTEYGIAEVWGRSIPDRIKAMTSIAHPQFREELKQRALSLGMVCPADFD